MTASTWRAMALVCVFTACGGDDGDPDAPLTPPACRAIPSFGSGDLCDETKPGAPACDGGLGFCAGGWLCFHGPEEAFCSCQVDSDCERRAEYVNQARASQKLAPISTSCQAGRCQGL